MDTLPRGEGDLYADPSANRARTYFASKPRAFPDKLTTVAEAVARLVADRDYLALGGFGVARLPVAVVHEVLRQGKQDLGFAGHTATHDFQLLCAAILPAAAAPWRAWMSLMSSAWRRAACRPHPPRHGVGRSRLCRVDQLRPSRCLRPRRWGCRSFPPA